MFVTRILKDTKGSCSNLSPYRMPWKGEENKNRKQNKKRKLFHWGVVQNALFWEVASLEKSKSFCLFWKTKGKKNQIFSVKKSFLNTHSGRIHWIRHSQGLWRSLEIDRCWKCKKFDKNNVLYMTTKPHLLSKYEHCPGRRISEHHGIFLEIKETHDLV